MTNQLKNKTMRDEEYLTLIKNGDKKAEEYILIKYKALVKIKARAYFLAGADQEDLIQEGMIGLYKAVCDYRPEENTLFSTFADVCISRRMITAIKNANRQKHRPLNQYIPFSRPINGGDGTITLVDRLFDEINTNPEELVIHREEKDYIIRRIPGALSRYEYKVLSLYLAGHSYAEISAITSRSEKSVDNALQRVRRKLAGIAEENA